MSSEAVSKDGREEIELEITDEEFLQYAKMAHQLDITLNQFVELAIKTMIDSIEAENKSKQIVEGWNQTDWNDDEN